MFFPFVGSITVYSSIRHIYKEQEHQQQIPQHYDACQVWFVISDPDICQVRFAIFAPLLYFPVAPCLRSCIYRTDHAHTQNHYT